MRSRRCRRRAMRCEIWGGTQSQTTAIEAPAKALGIPKNKVKLHDMLMGGGFGRRGTATMISSSTRC